jgi:hypothetical protein
MLNHAQRYTHAIDWSNMASANKMLQETNAFAQGEDAKLKFDLNQPDVGLPV